ncbi:MAG: serine/threonine protein kinase, partial [Cyanobacteria bacterium HKST-UBA02]|nr:serine/threonine protein kinase [Cyanobacteria bacterium HKST-UBA02]
MSLSEEMSEKDGKLLNDRYELADLIASGGMGEVYRATDLILKRVVAIKLLPGGFAGRDIQRLQREARVLGSLSHAHLVQIFDFGSSDDGRPYLVMEFLEGEDLERLIQSAPLSLSKVREIAFQILEGLAYMHSQGVVHRDLKPSNIFLVADENGQEIVKIIDLGLARLEETGSEEKDGQKLTRSGAAVGSPFYMSPEQVRSESPDSRSDIYAFGCLLFAMIAGRPPFVSDNPMATFEMHLKAAPPSLEQVTGKMHPEGLEDLIATCLEKDPDSRFQSIPDLEEALSSIDFDLSKSTAPESRKKSGKLFLPVVSLISFLLIASLAFLF